VTEVEIRYGNVFDYTLQARERGKRVIIHKGGTGSGKTEDIIIFLLFQVALTQSNKVITVVSESRPHLEIGAIRIMKKHLINAGYWDDRNFNKVDGRYTSPTGSIMEFFSADRIGKALGARRDWLYGNEINHLKKDIWDELARRSANIIADFNPTSQFWLEEWMENYNDTEVIKTNYLDNYFLPDYERERIEKRASRDRNFKRIHIDCEYGIYEGLVFTEWQQVDELPEGNVVYGLDFGYTNDPTALVAVIDQGDKLYVDEVIYHTGLHNRDIAGLMQEAGVLARYDEVFADAAEPKSIDELKMRGYNVKPAKKGPDSIIAGIDRIKTKAVYVTKRSTNLIKELRNYAWVLDKDGRQTNKPADVFNHAIDAMRYALAQGDEYRTEITINSSHRL
jgi:phage terminase large subunit